MNQQQAGVHEIERSLRRRVHPHVVTADLVARGVVHPGGIDVGGKDLTVRSHLLSQPGQEGGSAGAHLPDPPTRPQPERGKVAKRRRVEQLRQGVEALTRLHLPIVQQVALLILHPTSVHGHHLSCHRRIDLRNPVASDLSQLRRCR
jgi:hypothetical protein